MLRIGGLEIRRRPEDSRWAKAGDLEVRTVAKSKGDWNDFGCIDTWEHFLGDKILEFHAFGGHSCENVIEHCVRKLFPSGDRCEVLAEIPRLMLTFDESQVEVRDA